MSKLGECPVGCAIRDVPQNQQVETCSRKLQCVFGHIRPLLCQRCHLAIWNDTHWRPDPIDLKLPKDCRKIRTWLKRVLNHLVDSKSSDSLSGLVLGAFKSLLRWNVSLSTCWWYEAVSKGYCEDSRNRYLRIIPRRIKMESWPMTRPCVNVGWKNNGKLLDMTIRELVREWGGCDWSVTASEVIQFLIIHL
jgi:hypothetical protein